MSNLNVQQGIALSESHSALAASELFGRMNEADQTLAIVMSSIPLMTEAEALETGMWAFQHGNFAFAIRGKIEFELSRREESRKGINQHSPEAEKGKGKKAQTAKRAREMGVDQKTLYDDRRIYEVCIKPMEEERGGLEVTTLPEILPRGFYRAALNVEGHEQEAVEMFKAKIDANSNYSASDAWKDSQALKRQIENPQPVVPAPADKRIKEMDWRNDLEFARSKLAHLQEQVRYAPLAQCLNTVILIITSSLDATAESDRLVVLSAVEEGCSDPRGDLLNAVNGRDTSLPHVLMMPSELEQCLEQLVKEGECKWVAGNLDGRGPKTRLIAPVD